VFMKNLYLALSLLFSFSTQAFAGDDVQHACNVFYKKLKAVPHYKLAVNTGLLHSVSTGEEFRGCELVFKSNEKLMAGLELPSFEAPEGSGLYREGWRIDEHYRADGAGSGAYGIVNGRLLCRISWDQYSFVNDAGEFEQSELINMTVQCMDLQALNSPE
jgi:hypothetical protein